MLTIDEILCPGPIFIAVNISPGCSSRAEDSGLGYPAGAFPVAERTAPELLSLPLFAEITAEQQEQVVSVLAAALR